MMVIRAAGTMGRSSASCNGGDLNIEWQADGVTVEVGRKNIDLKKFPWNPCNDQEKGQRDSILAQLKKK